MMSGMVSSGLAPRGAAIVLPKLTGVDAALVAGLFSLTFIAFYTLLLGTTTIRVDNTFFGADAVENFDALQVRFYRTLGLNKHAIAVAVYAILIEGLRAVGFTPATAVIAATAGLSATSTVVVYLVLRSLGTALLLSLSLVAFYVAGNGVLTMFGIVETYALTIGAMAIGISAAKVAGDLYPSRPYAAALLAGLAAGAAALCNPPAGAVILIFAVIVMLTLSTPLVTRIRTVALASLITLLSGGVVLGILRWNSFSTFVSEYSQKYTSLSHFVEGEKIAGLLASVFAFAFVAPFDHPTPAHTAGDLALLFQSVPRAGALLVTLALMVGAAIILVRQPDRRMAAGLVVAFASMLIFYIYFNPMEAMLYVSQTSLIMLVLLALAFKGRRNVAWLILVLACALFSLNIKGVWI